LAGIARLVYFVRALRDKNAAKLTVITRI